jgi:hypothetical protein
LVFSENPEIIPLHPNTHLEGNSPWPFTSPLDKARLFSAKYLFIKVLAKERITGPKRNATSPRTANPGTSTAANQKQKPLTISENAPNVRKLSGSEKVESTGLTEPLIKPITKAAINAAGKLAIFTPGTTKSTINKLNAVAIAVKNVPHIVFTKNY